MNRRDFSRSVLAIWPTLAASQPFEHGPAEVNDIHSGLNATRVNRIETITSTDQLANVLTKARQAGKNISIAGGRHAMGGQQFGVDTVLLDTVKMNRVLHFDASKGLIEVEAGIEWPALIDGARQAYACVIFNIHVVHTAHGLRNAADSFRRLIDMAIRRDGGYYLTYHRWATRKQVEACYPQFAEFLLVLVGRRPPRGFRAIGIGTTRRCLLKASTRHLDGKKRPAGL